MKMKPTINIFPFVMVLLCGALLSVIAFRSIDIDTDIVRSLPTDDPVIADGIHLFKNNPVKDRIAIDIGTAHADTDLLFAAAETVESRLLKSDLFSQVGTQPIGQGIAELADQAVRHLPLLFTADELERQISPVLKEGSIRQALTKAKEDLYQIDGIGQALTIALDPLKLHQIALARLSSLNPAHGATIQRGRIISADRCHLLIPATPLGSGTDTNVARKIVRFFGELEQDLSQQFGHRITITPTGAFRAALDNESIVKKDVHRAVLWATMGIAVLLLAAFSRPLVGLLALMPALMGMIASFFIFSLIHDSISVMVLGFGGAIISITVDHGIAYLLFRESGSGNASREIRSVGLLAVLTSMGAFGVLAFSGFTVFEQLGQFTAVGIGCSFLFVHTIFPRLLLDTGAASSPPRYGFSKVVDRLMSTGRIGLIVAAAAPAVLIFFIRPHFNTDLTAMNSVSSKTQAADEMMAAVWGNIFSRVYLMIEAQNLEELQDKSDRLQKHLDGEIRAGHIEPTVTPAVFFPGKNRRAVNMAAWKQFWSKERIHRISTILISQGNILGFAPDAFDPFLQTLTHASSKKTTIYAGVEPILGISRDPNNDQWLQITHISPTETFDSEAFYQRLAGISTVFDPALFSQRMGHLLFTTFVKMFGIIGVCLIVLITVFFLDAGLVATALLPLAFSFICTLGTLGIMGRPLDIPALMLSVIILGMGVDYTLFLVRGYQRYQRFEQPYFAVVRTAVVMAAGSTLIGFAVLLGADHNLLKSAGWISFCGIGYCLMGATFILPPLLQKRFEGNVSEPGNITMRFANMEPYPRLFAHFKQRLDPLFDELATLAPADPEILNILDVGSGYGVPACWMANRYPKALIHGIEPEPERVRVASLALSERGRIAQGAAPDLPCLEVPLNLATMLDMSHFLTDREMEDTLQKLRGSLIPGGHLIMRSVLPPSARPHWTWWLGELNLKFKGLSAFYRDEKTIHDIFERCGFEVVSSRHSGSRKDMYWHVGKVRGSGVQG